MLPTGPQENQKPTLNLTCEIHKVQIESRPIIHSILLLVLNFRRYIPRNSGHLRDPIVAQSQWHKRRLPDRDSLKKNELYS